MIETILLFVGAITAGKLLWMAACALIPLCLIWFWDA